MSQQTGKQSFLEKVLTDLSVYLHYCGLTAEQDKSFCRMMEQYLKQSFKNGVKAGYGKAKREKREAVAQPEGQHPAM